MRESSVEKQLVYIRDNARSYAEAKAQRVYLDQFRKSKKALLMAEAAGNGISAIGKQETYAYSHSDYIDLLEALKIATAEEERLKILIRVAELKIETWRTQEANNRFERKAYNVAGA